MRNIRILSIVFYTLYLILHTGVASAATLQKPPNNLGLIGYWSFNEATGTVATDFSGNNHTLTLVSMSHPATASSGWANGKLGSALNFDGTDDAAQCSEAFCGGVTGAGLDMGTNDWTITAWVNPDTISGTDGIVYKRGDQSPETGPSLILNNGQLDCELETGVTFFACADDGGAVSINTWTFVAITFNRAGSAIRYLNGVSTGSNLDISAQSATSITGATNFCIGDRDSGSGVCGSSRAFDGKIDEVRVYKRVLTSTEIYNLYQSQSGLQKINSSQNNQVTNGLVGMWSFDGQDVTDKVYDRSGQGNNGYLYNNATSSAKVIGKLGQALAFDGTNDYIPVGSSSTYNYEYTQPWTISAWVKFNSPIVNGGLFSKQNTTAGQFTGYMLYWNTVQNGFLIDVRSNTSASIAVKGTNTTSLSLGTWYYVAGSYDGSGAASGVKIYVNGNAEGLSTLSDNLAGNTIINSIAPQIHGRNGANTMTDSVMDDVRLYNRVLTPEEIKQLYNIGGSKINVSTSTIPGTTLGTGLVGYWSFNGPDVTDKVYDRSGQGNNGYFLGGATSSAKTIGKLGQALVFDGVDDYVNLADPATLSPANGITMSGWVKLNNFTTTHMLLAKDSGGANGVFLRISSGNGVRCATGSGGTSDFGTLTTGDWYHLACTYDGSNMIVYINGSAVGSLAQTGTISYSIGTNWNIGSRQNGGALQMSGSIDEVRIYSRALTPDEIKQLYLLSGK